METILNTYEFLRVERLVMLDVAFGQRRFETLNAFGCNFIAPEIQLLQFRELLDLRWECGELVAAEQQHLKIRERAKLWRERGEIVAFKV